MWASHRGLLVLLILEAQSESTPGKGDNPHPPVSDTEQDRGDWPCQHPEGSRMWGSD
jgi:hypothetical protein